MKIGGVFGMRVKIPFWTKRQEKKKQRERDFQAKCIEAIHAEAAATDRYWKALARQMEKEGKTTKFPIIKFPGDDHE